jgi:predicted polyphosphate/ATP-dependent NAD kinase
VSGRGPIPTSELNGGGAIDGRHRPSAGAESPPRGSGPPAAPAPRRVGESDARRVGLIVNPLAGIGGRVGLKGSDGAETVARALALGAVPMAGVRALETLRLVAARSAGLTVATYPGEMGEAAAREAGFSPEILGSIEAGRTSAADTRRAAADLAAWGAELLLFAGGDGTARDLFEAVGGGVPVIGIPAGVKIHSGVFAVSPRRAAELVGEFLAGRAGLEDREVMDIDEDLFRAGTVSARLFGYMCVPYDRSLVQGAKAGSPSGPSTMRGVAFGVMAEIDRDPGAYWILGPGTTIKAVADEMGVAKTLLGVDLVHRGRLVATDLNEEQLLSFLARKPAGVGAHLVVTVIGGQGYLFGRGNQQLSPAVIRAVGKDGIVVAATLDKLHGLGGPLLVDTGDPACDEELAGYVKVVTGEAERVVWRVSA